jgi:hypothetical protein
MEPAVSHKWSDKSFRAKAEWFQSLSMLERIAVFTEMTDLIIGLNPAILDQRDAKSIPGRVRVLELPRS